MIRLPTTARIALYSAALTLCISVLLLGFIRFATVDEHVALEETLERSLLLALLSSLALGIASGILIARYVGQRVGRIARVVDDVAAGDMLRRIEVDGGNDAFDRLGRRINVMLDRVASLMDELRLLTDGLAHDLRSPVGRLRARVEQALLASDESQRDALLAGVIAEADTLTRLLTTVIEISRSESMLPSDQFAPLDPAALINGLGEMYEPIAEDRHIPFSTDAAASGSLTGHRELLAQALSNLIDNAFAYAGGAPVTLVCSSTSDVVTMGVVDRGPGIAAGERALAVRRFGRLDQSRGSPGAGLGLALVSAVAHLHGGRLDLSDAGPGLSAILTLPRRGRII